jgi:hypothetical protein
MVKIGNINLTEFPLLLAPMEDVSDPPFRAVCKDNGADLMYTEFISSEGLIRDAIKSRKKLDIFDYERPVGIQIFGGDEESLALAAKIVEVTQFWMPSKKSSIERCGRRRIERYRFDGASYICCCKSNLITCYRKNKIGLG